MIQTRFLDFIAASKLEPPQSIRRTSRRRHLAKATTMSASKNEDELVDETLYRLTQGLPLRELKKIVSEASACEELLKKDIQVLENALGKKDQQEDDEDSSRVSAIVDSLLTPMDRYWTASALAGRLRGDLAIPRIPTADPNVLPGLLLPPPKVAPPLEDPSAFNAIEQHPLYTKKHENPNTLLALYKKVSAHRSAVVFKRPVKPEEAPGYTDRIHFPCDLSLMRKMIIAQKIVTYKDFKQYITLIAHNCLTFNGRESDYGYVAREFEQATEEAIRQAVLLIERKTPPTAATTATAKSDEPATDAAMETVKDKTDDSPERSTDV